MARITFYVLKKVKNVSLNPYALIHQMSMQLQTELNLQDTDVYTFYSFGMRVTFEVLQF